MKIGIIGPSDTEIMPFIECMDEKEVHKQAMLTFYEGKYEDIDIVALYCGVCKVNAAIAAQILIDKFEVTQVIVVGVAGAISNKLKIGDTVISTEVAYHDVRDGILIEYHPFMDTIYFKADKELLNICEKAISKSNVLGSVYFGKIVTGEEFISDKGRERIIAQYEPLCVDMETAAITHVCHVNGIPFIAIRSITDTEEEFGVDVFEENVDDASARAIAILKSLLKEISICNEI